MSASATTVRTLAASAVLVVFGACSSSSVHSSSSHDAHGPAHWGYAGEVGPANWAALSADYSLCAGGQCQSPIDIVKPEAKDLSNPVFNYQPSAINILNNGHTVQVNYDPGSHVVIDGKEFALAQFHFHSPSEHRVNGAAFAAEMHLVHKADDGALAVVAVLIKQGRENIDFAPVWSQLPAGAGPARLAPGQVHAAKLLPRVYTSYRYGGSLTTPPCSENVTWCVLTTPVEMSESQIRAFTSIYTGNNRPVQAHNGRVVIEDTTP